MLRGKGLIGKFHFTRWGIVALVVVVALGTIGVTYAGWSGEKLLKGHPIKTAEFSDPFTWVVSNDDGVLENQGEHSPIDPGDNGFDPSENQTAGVELPEGGRYDKDVASTTAFLDVLVDPYNIDVTVTNAYPCYYPTIFYGIINDGNVPGKIDSIVVDEDFHPNEEDNIADNITALDVTVGGISVGQTVDAGEEVIGNLAIHVEQVAEQGHTYTIRVKIVTSVTECGECEGQVTMLTLRYNGAETAYIEVMERKTGRFVFEGWVNPDGDGEFTFKGTTKQGTLGPEIRIFVNNGELPTIIHTSCSQPIGPGLVVGDFEVVYGESKNGGKLCPIP